MRPEIPKCGTLAALGPGQRPSGPSTALLTFSPDLRRSACRVLNGVSSTHEARLDLLPSCQMNPSLMSGGLMFARKDWKETAAPDELCSVKSDSSSTSDATSVRRYETFATRVASSLTCRSGASDLAKNAASIEEVETLGRRPDGRKRHSPLPSFRVQKQGPSLFRLVLERRS